MAAPRAWPPMSARWSTGVINFWASHLDVESGTTRIGEVKALQQCATEWPEARILAGDYNMQARSAEYKQAVEGYVDAWAAAKASRAAKNYPGNCDGCTRNTRIDYVFSSAGATFLKLTSAAVLDTRDAK